MKIAIAGYGMEGEANYRYYAADQSNKITIVDQKQPERDLPAEVPTIISDDAFERLNGFDMVIRTAGLAPRKIKTDGRIWSATNEIFAKCPAPIIGVTGSKGKSTTVSIIASILRAAGRKVWLVGNIGSPALDILDKISPNDIVVYELSSFQLWDIEKSPHVAVILFIEQEHQDVHISMAEYVSAKANITQHQTDNDVLVYSQANSYARTIAEWSKAKLFGYPNGKSAHIKDGAFYYGEQKICSINALQVPGIHNQGNACAAIDAAWEYVNDPLMIEEGLRNFSGLPHRLQFIREFEGIKYYDDSIATTPTSAIAAMNMFDGPKVIILGGSPKGSDFSKLATELARHDVKALLIGEEAEKIAKACNLAGFADYEIVANPRMPIIVDMARERLTNGGVVLLSPAAASFGLFKNYADRGEQFQEAVFALQ